MRRLPSFALVAFTSRLAAREAEEMLRRGGLAVLDPRATLLACGGVLNQSDARVWVAARDPGADALRAAETLRSSAAVAWVAPVYELVGRARHEFVAPRPDRLVVQVIDEQGERFVREALHDDAELLELPAGTGLQYWRLHAPKERSAFDAAERLSAGEVGAFQRRFGFRPAEARGFDATFEFVPLRVPAAFRPDDPGYVDQWNMEQILAGGRHRSAWDLQQGGTDVTIAVLDFPIADLDDFAPSPAPLPAAPEVIDTLDNPHGKACAEIAAATIDNGVGVAGVAGGCPVLSVGFAWWTDVEVARAICAAVDAGAKVISLSAGSDAWSPALVDPAIAYAYRQNAVLCVAVHNHGLEDGITYPATNPLVIAVGASDRRDGRAVAPGWASNYGSELSVVAPAVGVPVTATPEGILEGTSAATPHVAGLAALLLLAEPSLCNDEVRDIIETTAEGHGTFVEGHPSGPWDKECGYGRINAREALRLAREYRAQHPRATPCHDPLGPSGVVLPASLGPIFLLGDDDVTSPLGLPWLDVQPSVAAAAKNVLEHASGLPTNGGHFAASLPHLDVRGLDVFDGHGRRLTARSDGVRLRFEVAGDERFQEEVVRRVTAIFEALDQLVRKDPAVLQNVQGIPPGLVEKAEGGERVVPVIGSYGSFADFAVQVLFLLQPPPWANAGSWWHNMWH